MRPLYLSMTAFGPYAGTQQLDFSELKGRSFFLIHGPTGSGKTTILDAMCFALYGDTSGARDGKAMRSDHADGHVLTEVIFDFAVGSDVYRLKRVPEQERPKKRGDGTTLKHAEAELYRLSDNSTEMIEAGWSKVTEKIEALLGFKSAQFRQVVLLPQGDFRKLLTANSAERQEIMQTLFKTELYQCIEDRLKSKAQELKKQFDELVREKQWILQEAAAASLEELQDRQNQNREAAVNQSGQLQLAALERDKAQQAVAAAKVIEAKFVEKAGAEQAFFELNNKVIVVEEKRAELVKMLKAAGLADAEKALIRLREDALALEQELAKRGQEVRVAEERRLAAEKQLAIEQAREEEREQTAREVMRLHELSGKVNDLEEAVKTADLSRQQAAESKKIKEVAAAKLNLVKTQLEQYSNEYKQELEIAGQLSVYQAKLTDFTRVMAARKAFDEAEKAAIMVGNQVAASDKTLTGLDAKYQQAKDTLTELQDKWVQGQAGVMASSLEQGKPCPVCGSLHHPQPAAIGGEVPDEQQIKNQQRLLQGFEQERESHRRTLSELNTEYHTLVNRRRDLEQDLGEMAIRPLNELAADEQNLEKSYQAALASEKKAKELARLISDLDEKGKAINEETERVEKNWRQVETDWQTAEAVANERRLAVPAEYCEPVALAKAQQRAAQKQHQLKAALDEAQNNVRLVSQQKVKCHTALEAVQNHLSTIGKRLENEEKDFDLRLSEAGFSTLAEYQQAKRPDAYRKKLEERISLFDSEMAAAKDRAERARAEIAGLQMPDMEGLNQTLEERQTQHSSLLAAYTSTTAQLEREAKWLVKLVNINNSNAEVEKSYSVVGRLAEVANGSNPFRLTFQRFVLGALLDDVASAANERLKTMSRGRYLLQRTMDRARKNAAGGLDLEVFDNYTGVARGVGTLSGGETFLASLSLALGLADVVQSYAGGMHLDTILVDEGFGTLDPEALDFALKALIDLQRGGRLVGIISHVPELKERIDARLEVVPTERGSQASFKVG